MSSPGTPGGVVKEGMMWKRGGSDKKKTGGNKKWKKRYFMFTGGSLYIYDSPTEESHSAVVHLKTSSVEEIPEKDSKRPLSFAVRNEKKDLWVAAESEESLQEWLRMLRAGIGKENDAPPERPKAKGFMYKAQKGLAEKAATSSLGRNILKEFLPDDSWFIMEALKTMITNTTSEKKAKQIEQYVIKMGVKVAYLYKGKHVTGDEMMAASRDPLLKTWDLFIKACDEKKRNIPEFCKSVRETHAVLDNFFKPHIAPKSMAKMKEVADYFADEATMTKLFSDPRHVEDLAKVGGKLTILKSLFLWLGQ